MRLEHFKRGDKVVEINVTEVARMMIDRGFSYGEPMDGWTQTLLEDTTGGELLKLPSLRKLNA